MRFWKPCAFSLTLVAALAAALTPSAALAGSTAGAASLQIPPDARAEGMGRFFNAVSDDAFAPWWNPAGLAFMRGWNAGLMHTKLVPDLADDVYYEYLGVSNYIEGWGGVAGTFTYLNYGTSTATDADAGTLGDFSSYEFSPSVALGTAILPTLGVGANLKLVHVSLAPEKYAGQGAGSGTSFAVDVGALYRLERPVDNLAGMGAGTMTFGLGATVANLGPNISLTAGRQSDPMPRNLKVGFSVGGKVPNAYSLLLGASVEKSLVFTDFQPDTTKTNAPSFYDKHEVLLSGGLELGIMDMVFGRLGYIYDDPGEIKDFTFGAGFRLKEFGLDFASIPQATDLDRVSKFSVVVAFD